MDLIVHKYVDLEKRLMLSEYKRNKDKKKIKRITNDLYEEYEDKTPHSESTQQPKPVITDDNFESKLKGIIDDNIEDNKDNKNKSENQQYEPSFILISRRRK
jgi:hypothetical protein